MREMISLHGTQFLFGERFITIDFLSEVVAQKSARPAFIVDKTCFDNDVTPFLDSSQAVFPNALILPILISEKNKNRHTKAFIEDQLLENGYGRDSFIIAIGGGALTDIAGFVAATFCRGVPIIYIPTTTLSMFDAAIGGKTGVNTIHGKNLIGAFYHPKAVLFDTTFLSTLPGPIYIDGFAELIKHGIIADQLLFKQLETSSPDDWLEDSSSLVPLLERNCHIKLSFTESDEKESGKRACLNFGHTIGHAIESASDGQYAHGQSIAFGMLAETYLSVKRDYCSHKVYDRLKILLSHYGFLLEAKRLTANKVLPFLQRDKKNRNQTIRTILIKEIGETLHSPDKGYTHPLNISECIDALGTLSIL
jgi:3-dehydroquinate synthase